MRLFVLVMTVCVLHGCQIYKSAFDCPHSPGLGCVSVSHINELIDRGELSYDGDKKTGNTQQVLEKTIKTKDLTVTIYNDNRSVTRRLSVEERP